MRRTFITSDLHQARQVLKEKLGCAFRVRFVPILLLSLCLPSPAQVTQSSPTSDDLSTSVKPVKPYEQIVSGNIPLQPRRRIGRFTPFLFPAEMTSDKLQAESVGTCSSSSAQADCSGCPNPQQQTFASPSPDLYELQDAEEPKRSEPARNSKTSQSVIGTIGQGRERLDINSEIYRRNRLDFALDVGWHPVNIPFIYDFAVGDSYNMTPLKYTLVPIIASLRWQVTNVGWPWIFRGNMDFTFSGSITPIPRGTETHYYAFMFGIRRNFVHRNWKAVPFFEQRGGAGVIDAKEPLGVLFSQGQNLTFTYTLGVGVRYNFNPKYSFSAGMNYMHISNGYLSEPKFTNYGINVYGPMFGFDMRLGKPRYAAQ
jgi:lipid A 3-O-deacylase PagL